MTHCVCVVIPQQALRTGDTARHSLSDASLLADLCVSTPSSVVGQASSQFFEPRASKLETRFTLQGTCLSKDHRSHVPSRNSTGARRRRLMPGSVLITKYALLDTFAHVSPNG